MLNEAWKQFTPQLCLCQARSARTSPFTDCFKPSLGSAESSAWSSSTRSNPSSVSPKSRISSPTAVWSSASKNPTAKNTDQMAKRSVTLTSSGPSPRLRCFSSRATNRPKNISKGSPVSTAKPRPSLSLPTSSGGPSISCSKTRRLLTKNSSSVSNYWRGWISLPSNWNLSGHEHAPASIRVKKTHASENAKLMVCHYGPVAHRLIGGPSRSSCFNQHAMLVRFCPSPEPGTNWGAFLHTPTC